MDNFLKISELEFVLQQQQQMILQFAERSTMNVEWSYKWVASEKALFLKAVSIPSIMTIAKSDITL